jgi:hypothetical protein
MKRMKFADRVAKRRVEAEERQAARDALGDAGQLKRLDAAGLSECREAKRLRAKLDAEQAKAEKAK